MKNIILILCFVYAIVDTVINAREIKVSQRIMRRKEVMLRLLIQRKHSYSIESFAEEVCMQ